MIRLVVLLVMFVAPVFRVLLGQTSIEWVQMSQGLTDIGVQACTYSGGCIFAGTKTGVFRSVDLGEHWTKSSNGLPQAPAGPFAEVQRTLFVACNGLLFRSSDSGQSWVSTNSCIHCVVPNEATIASDPR